MKTVTLLLIVILTSKQLLAQPDLREEFNGPLNSWANAKKLGAKGDGRTDDTKAIQELLDKLTDERFKANADQNKAYSVIYFPKGIYRITKPLYLTKKVGIVIIGEDPTKTIIRFDGANNSTILYCNGSSYFKVSRLQFQATGKKDVTGIGIHWHKNLNSSTSYAPQGMEISECIFKDGFARGIAGGALGSSQQDATNSEVSIRNCHFYQCSDAAIYISGYNALNYWIWNCRFLKCATGVMNRFGNSYVYRSYFSESTKADVFNYHGYFSSIRGCYSNGSKYFYRDNSYSCNPFKRVLEGNFVKNCTDFPIEYSDFGFMTLLNNYFLKNNSNYPTIVNIVTRNGICKADEYRIYSMGNYYGYSTPLLINKKQLKEYNFTIGDKVFNKTNDEVNEDHWLREIMLPFSPYIKRKVFELRAGSTDREIQEAVNEASSKWKGQRPVIHLPWGKYDISSTVTIPEGSDCQLVGDGFLRATILKATPQLKGKYFFTIKGPSTVVIRDMQIGWETGREEDLYGIQVLNADQNDAQIFIDQIKAPWTTRAMLVDKLSNAYVQKTNSYYAYRDEIRGSSAHLNGKSNSTVNLFGGQPGFFSVSNKAKYFVKDTWFEGSMKDSVPFQVKGNGTIVLDCARLGTYDYGNKPVLEVKDFTGQFLLMNSYVDNTISVDVPSSRGTVLFMNLFMNYDPILKSGKATGNQELALTGISSGQQKKTVPDYNAASVRRLMQTTLGLNKNHLPRYYTKGSDKITNVYFSRICFGNVKTAFRFSPSNF